MKVRHLLKKLPRLLPHRKPVRRWPSWLLWSLVVGVAFVCGLAGSVVIYNVLEHRKVEHIEVTFIDPHQAIIFWTTTKETKGYVRYGATAKSLNQTAYQTSSVPGTIHAVLLTDVPLGGVYYSLHTEADSIFLWPTVKHIIFDPTTIE